MAPIQTNENWKKRFPVMRSRVFHAGVASSVYIVLHHFDVSFTNIKPPFIIERVINDLVCCFAFWAIP